MKIHIFALRSSSWRVLERSWCLLGRSWGPLGPILAHLGRPRRPKREPKTSRKRVQNDTIFGIEFRCDFHTIVWRPRGRVNRGSEGGTSRSARSGRPLASCCSKLRSVWPSGRKSSRKFRRWIYNTRLPAAQGAADRAARNPPARVAKVLRAIG